MEGSNLILTGIQTIAKLWFLKKIHANGSDLPLAYMFKSNKQDIYSSELLLPKISIIFCKGEKRPAWLE